MTLGKKIREFGLKKFGKLTIFAQNLDMELPSLYHYFNNKSKPGFDFLLKLRNMGCDIEWLFSDDEDPLIMKEPSIKYKNKQLEQDNKKLKTENETLRTEIGRIANIAQAVEKIIKLDKEKK